MPRPSGEQLRQKYPVSDTFTVLSGYDIERNSHRITALVAVRYPEGGTALRLYSWKNRNNQWKVDLARLNVAGWDFVEIAQAFQDLKRRYEAK